MRELRVGITLFFINVVAIMIMTSFGVDETVRALVVMGIIGAGFPLLWHIDRCLTDK